MGNLRASRYMYLLGKHQGLYQQLLKDLVPHYGYCDSLQAEALRVVSVVDNDLYVNHGGNLLYGRKESLEALYYHYHRIGGDAVIPTIDQHRKALETIWEQGVNVIAPWDTLSELQTLMIDEIVEHVSSNMPPQPDKGQIIRITLDGGLIQNIEATNPAAIEKVVVVDYDVEGALIEGLYREITPDSIGEVYSHSFPVVEVLDESNRDGLDCTPLEESE